MAPKAIKKSTSPAKSRLTVAGAFVMDFYKNPTKWWVIWLNVLLFTWRDQKAGDTPHVRNFLDAQHVLQLSYWACWYDLAQKKFLRLYIIIFCSNDLFLDIGYSKKGSSRKIICKYIDLAKPKSGAPHLFTWVWLIAFEGRRTQPKLDAGSLCSSTQAGIN
jgi:hypothetical protein